MAVLHNQRTHIHKERRRIYGIVEQHTTAMAQQAQEPARWLSAKSHKKNRRAIPSTRLPARGLGTRIHPITKGVIRRKGGHRGDGAARQLETRATEAALVETTPDPDTAMAASLCLREQFQGS